MMYRTGLMILQNVKVILQDLLANAHSMYILLNKFYIVYMHQ